MKGKLLRILFVPFAILLAFCDSSPKKTHSPAAPSQKLNLSISDAQEIVARDHVRAAISLRAKDYRHDTIIQKSSTAIAIAEQILFDKYGKTQIISQRPYQIYLIDGYWFIAGTVPSGSDGGGFEIIFSALDGQVIKVTHYK